MSEASERVDDKADVRGELDIAGAQWQQTAPGVPDQLEVAFVPHDDGQTYTLMRQADQPDRLVLIFTEGEWTTFCAGVRDGELTPEQAMEKAQAYGAVAFGTEGG